jgi:hypothetical protein
MGQIVSIKIHVLYQYIINKFIMNSMFKPNFLYHGVQWILILGHYRINNHNKLTLHLFNYS